MIVSLQQQQQQVLPATNRNYTGENQTNIPLQKQPQQMFHILVVVMVRVVLVVVYYLFSR